MKINYSIASSKIYLRILSFDHSVLQQYTKLIRKCYFEKAQLQGVSSISAVTNNQLISLKSTATKCDSKSSKLYSISFSRRHNRLEDALGVSNTET
jgi:ribosomal protein S10